MGVTRSDSSKVTYDKNGNPVTVHKKAPAKLSISTDKSSKVAKATGVNKATVSGITNGAANGVNKAAQAMTRKSTTRRS
jgi:hypothetical protein